MVDRKRIELFPKACKAPVLPLSLTAHLKILHQYIVFVKLKNKNWMTTTCEYTRISLLCSIYHMSNSFNFSLLYLLMVACYNSNTLTVKSKNLPYPIWIRFVRVRHTGVYRVPHAVGRFHPTRTSL